LNWCSAGAGLVVFDAESCMALAGSRGNDMAALRRFLDRRKRYNESMIHNATLVRES